MWSRVDQSISFVHLRLRDVGVCICRRHGSGDGGENTSCPRRRALCNSCLRRRQRIRATIHSCSRSCRPTGNDLLRGLRGLCHVDNEVLDARGHLRRSVCLKVLRNGNVAVVRSPRLANTVSACIAVSGCHERPRLKFARRRRRSFAAMLPWTCSASGKGCAPNASRYAFAASGLNVWMKLAESPPQSFNSSDTGWQSPSCVTEMPINSGSHCVPNTSSKCGKQHLTPPLQAATSMTTWWRVMLVTQSDTASDMPWKNCRTTFSSVQSAEDSAPVWTTNLLFGLTTALLLAATALPTNAIVSTLSARTSAGEGRATFSSKFGVGLRDLVNTNAQTQSK